MYIFACMCLHTCMWWTRSATSHVDQQCGCWNRCTHQTVWIPDSQQLLIPQFNRAGLGHLGENNSTALVSIMVLIYCCRKTHKMAKGVTLGRWYTRFCWRCRCVQRRIIAFSLFLIKYVITHLWLRICGFIHACSLSRQRVLIFFFPGCVTRENTCHGHFRYLWQQSRSKVHYCCPQDTWVCFCDVCE